MIVAPHLRQQRQDDRHRPRLPRRPRAPRYRNDLLDLWSGALSRPYRRYSTERVAADPQGSRVWVSRKFSDLTGLSDEQALGWGWLQAAHPEDRERAEKAWREALRTSGNYYTEWRVRLRDGSYRYCATRAVPILKPRQDRPRWVGIVIDIDDSKRYQERLELAQQELEARVTRRTSQLNEATNGLRRLAGMLLRSQDEERRRIARELHDSVGQFLAALGMNFSRISSEASRLSPDANRALSESGEMLTELTTQVRTISHLLHPPLLEEVGLEAALRWFADGFSQRSGIQVSIDMPPNLQRLDNNLEIAVFRVTQECLTNIHRHSGSKTAGSASPRNRNIFGLKYEIAARASLRKNRRPSIPRGCPESVCAACANVSASSAAPRGTFSDRPAPCSHCPLPHRPNSSPRLRRLKSRASFRGTGTAAAGLRSVPFAR